MEDFKNGILNKWLEIDLNNIAYKMGLVNESKSVSYNLILDTIRCLDFESTLSQKASVNYIITVIGLMWEYVDHSKYDLRKIIIKFLSRIGYPTAAILCDKDFNINDCTFSGLDSWIDEVTLSINQSKYEVCVAGHNYLLTDYQKKIWDSMDKDKVLGISAPTSAGKSFVILLKIVNRMIFDNIDVVYIVPTLSLLNQVTEDFNKLLKKSEVTNYWISNAFNNHELSDKKNIYIMTQEKALDSFSSFNNAFTKKMILVVDEIQNIERIDEYNDQRAKKLFDTLMEFRYKENVEQIIISGPRIDDIETVGKNIFGKETKDHTTDISPVLNLTYSIKKYESKFYLKQYCALTSNPLSLLIENSNIIEGYGGKKYTENYLSFLNDLVKSVGENCQNLVFSPTSDSARKIAFSLSNTNNIHIENDLIIYYQNTVRHNYSLCQTLEKGIAYHHGKLPMHVRRTLERAISEKKIKTVVCTTTLLQGVNLPAQNVFIRNPHLYLIKKSDSAELTNYEMANLRGRAGRLLKDYIGRTFVMDEDSFLESDGYEQLDLFDDVSKELPSSYERKYKEHKDFIDYALNHNNLVDNSMKEYGYIVTYIRQTILKHGEKSYKRLKDVGINLTQNQIDNYINKLESIIVPNEICLRNRYWDPFILNDIFTSFEGSLPNTPMDNGAKEKLDNAMRYLRSNAATVDMYNRHIPPKYREGKMRHFFSTLSLQWACGEQLNKILNNSRYDGEKGADNIDSTIELLQNTISFNFPLLLKPLFDIKAPDSPFLKCMQVGAFNEVERCMIEMGIPRETAFYLYDNTINKNELKFDTRAELEQLLRSQISIKYDEIPHWIQVQLDFLI